MCNNITAVRTVTQCDHNSTTMIMILTKGIASSWGRDYGNHHQQSWKKQHAGHHKNSSVRSGRSTSSRCLGVITTAFVVSVVLDGFFAAVGVHWFTSSSWSDSPSNVKDFGDAFLLMLTIGFCLDTLRWRLPCLLLNWHKHMVILLPIGLMMPWFGKLYWSRPHFEGRGARILIPSTPSESLKNCAFSGFGFGKMRHVLK